MLAILLYPLVFLFVSQGPQAAQEANRQFVRQVLQAHLGSVNVADIEATVDNVDANGRRHFVKYFFQGTKSMRVESGLGTSQSVSVTSNGSAWQSRGGKTESLPDHAAMRHVRTFPFLDLLSEWNNPELVVTPLESTTIGNAAVYHIRLRLKDRTPNRLFAIPLDEESDFYIDAQSLLVRRSEMSLRAMDDMNFRVRSAVDFTDYRNVNGVMIPFHLTFTTGTAETGVHTSITRFQSILVNRGLSPALFDRGQQQ